MARSRLGFAPQVVKYLILAINAVSLFAGILLIVVGAYIANADRDVTGITSNYLPTGLLCLGSFIGAISLLGCFGAHKEISGVLKLYFLLLCILVFFQIVIGAIAFVKQREADVTLDNQWSNAVRLDPGMVQDVEKLFGCCGFANVTDRAVPETCATDQKIDVSCKGAVTAAFLDNLKTVGITGFVMGLFELFGLIFSAVLFTRIRKMHEQDKDAALLDAAKKLEAEGRLSV